MAEQKHTPGPWRIDARHVGPHRMHYRIFTAAGSPLVDWVGDYNDADARLVAAAPDLLAALKLLWREVDLSGNAYASDNGWPAARAAVTAAIDKAEGR